MKRWLLGKVIDGKYRVDSHIGGGAFGEVFKATEVLGETEVRKVALKVIKQLDLAALPLEHYFKDSIFPAMILGRTDDDGAGKHIVQIYNWGLCEISYKKSAYIAMELIDNSESLQRHIDRNRQAGFFLDAKAIENYAVQLFKGLTLAHKSEVIHRDLKPENILIRAGVLKITDFGLGLGMVGKAGVLSEFGGTIHYMAPESFHGIYCFASDVYSAGLVVYELWHNAHPFDFTRNQFGGIAEDNMKLQTRARNNWRFRAGQEINPLVCESEKLYEILKKCLTPNVSQRYQSADEVLRDLEGGFKTKGEMSITRGAEAYEKGNWETAIANLEGALLENLDNLTRFSVLEKLGYAYKEQGLADRSLKRFEQAFELNERYKLCCQTNDDFRRRDELCGAIVECYEKLGNNRMAGLFHRKIGVYS